MNIRTTSIYRYAKQRQLHLFEQILLSVKLISIHLSAHLYKTKPIFKLTIKTFSVSIVLWSVLRNGKAPLSLWHSLSPRHTTLLTSWCCQSTTSRRGRASHTLTQQVWCNPSVSTFKTLRTGLCKNTAQLCAEQEKYRAFSHCTSVEVTDHYIE